MSALVYYAIGAVALLICLTEVTYQSVFYQQVDPEMTAMTILLLFLLYPAYALGTWMKMAMFGHVFGPLQLSLLGALYAGSLIVLVPIASTVLEEAIGVVCLVRNTARLSDRN